MLRKAPTLAVLGLALGAAGCGLKVGPATDSNRPGTNIAISDPALQAAERLGARAVQDNDRPGKPVVELYVGNQAAPANFKELAAFKELRVLWLNGAKLTDADLKYIAGLEHLRKLTLTSTAITGVGLKELAGLKELEELDLSFSKVDDAGMKTVAGLTSLKSLSVLSTPVTDAGLKELTTLVNLEEFKAGQCAKGGTVGDVGVRALGGLKKLKRLDITNCDLGDYGLKGLAGLTQLQHLFVYGTRIGDDGVKAIAGLPHLQELWLSFDVTDAGVRALTGLHELRELTLTGLSNTDACLNDLAQIKSLKKLELRRGTQISAAALDRLRAALPNCSILYR